MFFTTKVGDANLEEAIRMTFLHHCNMPEMQRILEHCLASILHHQPTMEEWNSNHLGLQMPIFRDKELLQSLVDVVDLHQACDSNLVLTGIPPFIKQIQELHIIREEQKTMVECVVEGVMDKVVKFFETRKIGGGEWTEKRMKELVGGLISTEFSTFETRVRKHVQDLADSFAESTGNTKPVTTDSPGQPTKKRGVSTVGELRCVGGRMTRLPKDFEFPSAGIQDLWMQWNTPNTKRNILAFRTLGPADFAWMDNRDKTLNERRLAKGKLKRRPVRKTLCDIKFFCNFIEETAVKEGLDPTDKSVQNLQRMCEVGLAAITTLKSTKAKAQNRWKTVCLKLREQRKGAKSMKRRSNAPEMP